MVDLVRPFECCPQCDSLNIEAPSVCIVSTPNTAYQSVECCDCGCVWQDQYVLKNFIVTVDGSTVEDE